jgi:hypothetical protein
VRLTRRLAYFVANQFETNMPAIEQSHFALEKYGEAIEALATGPGGLRGRLANVRQFLFWVSPLMVPESDHMREDVAWILSQLKPGRSGLRYLSSKRLEMTARRIYSVFWRLYLLNEHDKPSA